MSSASSSKRKAISNNPDTNIIQFTARNPPWTYLKLQLVHQPNTSPAIQSQPLDPLTARTYLTAALSQFLGLTGTSIPIDILKISPGTPQPTPTPTEKIVWIRVPRQDAHAVVVALSSWIGGGGGSDVDPDIATATSTTAATKANDNTVGHVAWRVCAKGNFLGALVQGSGADLFAS